jgi:glycosyltransferase involved in cell wall biosynthesis
MRAVIWIPGDDTGWQLPAAEPTDHGWVGGGRQTLHEIAVALACAGHEVEMRGEVSVPLVRMLSDSAGASPGLPSEPREPAETDTVIVYEGIEDPLIYARLALSPARTVLAVLAPPGLFGWPFTAEWSLPDPETVDIATVARPEHFRAAAAFGFELWTHSPGMVRAIEAAGLDCSFTGNGRSSPYPAPAAKDVDVLTVANNRWGALASDVARDLEARGIRCVSLPMVRNEELLEWLGRARVLVHPSRVEGHSRIGQEARAMGAVPVVLDTNPYAVGLDESAGAVAVGSVGEMADAVTDLLRDPDRLERLSATGMETARHQVEWGPFVQRVSAAFEGRTDDPARGARAVFGRGLRRSELGPEVPPAELAQRDGALQELEEALDRARSELARHKTWLDSMKGSVSWRLTAPLRAVKRGLRTIGRR